MKKILLPILMFMLLFYGCQSSTIETSKDISINDVEGITIKALPSPSKSKTIDKKEDVQKIVEFLNSIDKEKTNQEDINGWEFWIVTKGKKEHSITFVGNLININNVWYKINPDEIKEFRQLYNQLNYKEEPVI